MDQPGEMDVSAGAQEGHARVAWRARYADASKPMAAWRGDGHCAPRTGLVCLAARHALTMALVIVTGPATRLGLQQLYCPLPQQHEGSGNAARWIETA